MKMKTHNCKGSLNTIIMKCWKKWQDVCMKSLRVKAATAGELNITEGALYPAYNKLEAEF
jgi:hypothetical protein